MIGNSDIFLIFSLAKFPRKNGVVLKKCNLWAWSAHVEKIMAVRFGGVQELGGTQFKGLRTTDDDEESEIDEAEVNSSGFLH